MTAAPQGTPGLPKAMPSGAGRNADRLSSGILEALNRPREDADQPVQTR